MAINKKKVLLVKDDHILNDALSMKLSQSGFSVIKCLNCTHLSRQFLEIF